MESILTFIEHFGDVASSVLVIIAFLGAVALYSKKARGGINHWIQCAAGTEDIKKTLENHIKQINEVLEKHMDVDVYSKDILIKTGNALVCVLRSDIKSLCEKCIIAGSIHTDELELLSQAYDSYISLGGNSFIKGLVATVKTLPIKNN
ncbi:MAG: hypothetical protein WCO84_01520 [bacterium]